MKKQDLFYPLRIWLDNLVKPSINVEGTLFRRLQQTLCKTNSVGFSVNKVIKIEHKPHSNKLLNLLQEAELILELNSKGCVTCPQLISTGMLDTGEPYMITERIIPRGAPSTSDMLLALLEQKNLGIYQGDFKPSNMIFDGAVCYLIDYDQAQKNDDFAKMGNVEFIDWIAEDFKKRRNEDFFTQKDRNFNKTEFYNSFTADAFDMSYTSILANQVTTATDSGIYHKLFYSQVFTQGARDINQRMSIMDSIDFKSGEKVLDVGCNLGLLSHYFYGRGCDVTGIDMDRHIVKAAKIVSNIIGKQIEFETMDMSTHCWKRKFDTICLFSVFHHIQEIESAANYISQSCQRVILESKLIESGSVPINGKWVRTNSWNFQNIAELIAHIEKLLQGFKLEKVWGSADRDRHIITFLRE